MSEELQPTRPVLLAVWNFSSSWFLAPQGVAIIAAILHQLHYQFDALPVLAKIVWIYAIVLLCLSLAIYITRIVLYPRHVLRQIRTSVVEASCLASIPIAFTSIIQMISLQYTGSADLVAYVLWWISTALSMASVIGVPYLQLKMQPAGLEHVPPALLLPIISILTSAAGGGTICENSTLSARLRVPAIIISYMELGAGMALTICVDACIMYHHFDQNSPVRDNAYQDMVLCGPYGQASFALHILGSAIRHSFGAYNRGSLLTEQAAVPMSFVSQFAGVMAWGFSSFWWFFAILSIVYTLHVQSGGFRTLSFSLTAWSLIFPWGVYTNAAVQMGKEMDSPAFNVWSTALLLMLVVMWIVVNLLTIKAIITGKVFGLESGWKVPKSEEHSV